MAATMASVSPSNANPHMPHAVAGFLPSPAGGPPSGFLHPANQPGGSRRGSITDPHMHAQPAYPDANGSRPSSSHHDQANYERRPSLPDSFDGNFAFGYDRRPSSANQFNAGAKRKTSSEAAYTDEASGGSSQDLSAKRRSSAFADAAHLAQLSLNHRGDRRSSVGSTYSTTSSTGWSPAQHAAYGWGPAMGPNGAVGPPGMAPYSTFAPPGFPGGGGGGGGMPPHQAYGPPPGAFPEMAPRQPALSEQLANYGFPPPGFPPQSASSIGPLRRGSAPALRSADASGSDPSRVFGPRPTGEGDLPSTRESRANSMSEEGSGGSANNDAAAGGNGVGIREAPYSRSPELRVSHKLAERKRRKEMTQLFDELRDAVPIDRGSRASKWETLVKAIDYIAHLKELNDELARDNEVMRGHMGIPSRPTGALPYLAQQAAAAAAVAAGHNASGMPMGAPPPHQQQQQHPGMAPHEAGQGGYPGFGNAGGPYLAPPHGWPGSAPPGQTPPGSAGGGLATSPQPLPPAGQTTPRPGQPPFGPMGAPGGNPGEA